MNPSGLARLMFDARDAATLIGGDKYESLLAPWVELVRDVGRAKELAPIETCSMMLADLRSVNKLDGGSAMWLLCALLHLTEEAMA